MEKEGIDESSDEIEEEERSWASFRGQTLSRTGEFTIPLKVISI